MASDLHQKKSYLPPLLPQINKGKKGLFNTGKSFCSFSSTALTQLIPFSKYEIVSILNVMGEELLDMGFNIRQIRLYIINDYAVTLLNRQIFGLDGPTNILSFPGSHDMAGELLLSHDTWARECVLYGQKPVEYFIFLLAHGCAHLTGLDHGTRHDTISLICREAVYNKLSF